MVLLIKCNNPLKHRYSYTVQYTTVHVHYIRVYRRSVTQFYWGGEGGTNTHENFAKYEYNL